MLALLAICVLAFAILFLTVLRLLREAKANTRQAVHPVSATPAVRRARKSTTLPDTVFDESLSRLVPGKQPDWRYMVRERQQPTHASRADRVFAKEDSGDLSDPVAPSRSERIRRAG